MKKMTFLIPVVALFFVACGGNGQDNKTEAPAKDTSLAYFGDTITMDGAIAADQLEQQMNGKDSVTLKLTGTLVEVCQKKGCWMTMGVGGDKTMQVRFKDYGFFVPKDAGGKTAVIEGVAFKDTTSVEELKHYAEDAGKPQAEIDAINQPEINVSFEAHGVIIKK